MEGFDKAGKPKTVENVRVAQEITGALTATGRAPLGRLQVLASDGVVTLRGQVSSFYLKQVAQAVAQRVGGVRQVCNEVDVG